MESVYRTDDGRFFKTFSEAFEWEQDEPIRNAIAEFLRRFEIGHCISQDIAENMLNEFHVYMKEPVNVAPAPAPEPNTKQVTCTVKEGWPTAEESEAAATEALRRQIEDEFLDAVAASE